MNKKNISKIIRLLRLSEHLTYALSLTLLGSLLAINVQNSFFDFRIIAVVLANVLCMAYAFGINDIEDAPDDKHDKLKAKKNVIASGEMSHSEGVRIVRLIAFFALIFYMIGGFLVVVIGISNLLLSHLYSWKKVRLKAWPVVDILSHSAMLSGLLFISGYVLYSSQYSGAILVGVSVTLLSVYGQLYNQVRDFKLDKKAGLKNTAIVVGMNNAKKLMYGALTVALVLFATATYKGTFPFWLILPVIGFGLFAIKINAKSDASGSAAIDITGAFQTQVLILINGVILTWLGVEIIGHYF